MIIDRVGFKEIVARLASTPTLGLDLETTGLRPYHGDKMISTIVSDKNNSFYFNFYNYENLDPKFVLPWEWQEDLWELFPGKKVFMANPKFDLSFIQPKKIDEWHIHDVLLIERLIHNNNPEMYDLGNVAKWNGFEKSEVVEEYIKKNKLWAWESIPGKKTRTKNKFFYKVPFEIIAPYGMQDARITYDIGVKQESSLEALQKNVTSSQDKDVWLPATYEKKLTKTLWKMEHKGILVDKNYCEEAIEFLRKEVFEYEQKFKASANVDEFKDSAKFMSPILKSFGIELGQTEKGNDQINADALERSEHELAKILLEHRGASKRLNTYFRAFLYHADGSGIVHPNFRQSGTKSGRMSCNSPNLQNQISEDPFAEDVHPYTIKRAFIPRPGRRFFELDYDQMEFRLMLLYAGQMDLIEAIRGGLDPHQATADLTGLSRRQAKTLNFAVLYGTGAAKIAKMIGCTLEEAKTFKRKYFDALPRVETFIRYVSNQAKSNGYTTTWDGRIHWFDNPNFAYKGVNYVIQGGCAGIAKQAMNRADNILRDGRADMLVQVHDSLLIEVDEGSEGLIGDIKQIMENTLKREELTLTVSVEEKKLSWLS